jgi:phosphotriesterase-related protein
MQAAVVAQQETGAALTIHPPRFPFSPLEIVAFVRDHGGDVSRTVIGHVDRTIFDRQALYRLADSGCVIEFDFFGIESSYYPFQEELDLPNDGARLDAIRDLVKRGHVGRVLMSHDICTKTQLVRYGGHGYAHILRNIVPAMKRKDFTDEELRTILQEWPRALLAVA